MAKARKHARKTIKISYEARIKLGKAIKHFIKQEKAKKKL